MPQLENSVHAWEKEQNVLLSTSVARYSREHLCCLLALLPSHVGLGQGFAMLTDASSLVFSEDRCFFTENTQQDRIG